MWTALVVNAVQCDFILNLETFTACLYYSVTVSLLLLLQPKKYFKVIQLPKNMFKSDIKNKKSVRLLLCIQSNQDYPLNYQAYFYRSEERH